MFLIIVIINIFLIIVIINVSYYLSKPKQSVIIVSREYYYHVALNNVMFC